METAKIILNRECEKNILKETHTLEEFIKSDEELDYTCFELEEENPNAGVIIINIEEDLMFLNTNFDPTLSKEEIGLEDVQTHPGLYKDHIFKFKKLEKVIFKEDI